MSDRKNIESSKIEGLIPRQLVEDSQALVTFLKEYYNFLNQEGGASYALNTLLQNRDVDTAVDDFLTLIHNEIGTGFAKEIRTLEADKNNLYKHIKEFYSCKGSLDSFQTLFKLLFNTNVEIILPKEQILIASDGRWSQQESFFIEASSGDPLDLYGKIITVVSNQNFIDVEVERIRKVYPAQDYYEIFITRNVNTNRIEVGATFTFNGIAGTVIDSLGDIELIYAGQNFEVPQFVDIDYQSTGTLIRISEVTASGGIQKFKIISFGIGYTNDFYARIVPRSEISGAAADPEYNNGELKALTGDGSDFFKKELTVNGVRLVAAGAVGGQLAVPDEFIKKVARMYELFTDPLAAGINVATQRQFIKDLSGDAGDSYHAGFPTIQRIARGAGSDYTPNFLTDQGIIDWNLTPLFDSHVANDMVWYLNSTGSGYGDGDIDAQEVIEHVFHTLHMHGLPAFDLKMYPEFSADWQTGDLFAAIEEAYDAGVFDPSGYVPATWKTDPDAFPVIAKEYLYLLNFCMFEYSGLWEGGSLAPEWSDSMRTPAGILANNPLGYALFNTYIAPVISKPSLATIQNIFQDGDVGDPTIAGLSGYIADATSGVDLIISTDPDADKVTHPTHAIIKFSNAAIAQYTGEFTNNKGFLSDDIYLQDNYYYQQYSYVIKSGLQIESYRNIVNKTVHPAGMIFFGQFEITNEFDLAQNIQSIGRFLRARLQSQFSVTDSFTAYFEKLLESSVTPAEEHIVDYSKNLLDVSDVTPAEAHVVDYSKNTSSDVSTSFVRTYDFDKPLASSAAVTESLIYGFDKLTSSSVSTSFVVEKEIEKDIESSVAAASVVNIATNYNRFFASSVTATDTGISFVRDGGAIGSTSSAIDNSTINLEKGLSSSINTTDSAIAYINPYSLGYFAETYTEGSYSLT